MRSWTELRQFLRVSLSTLIDLLLCTLSGYGLHLCKNIFGGFRVTERTQFNTCNYKKSIIP